MLQITPSRRRALLWAVAGIAFGLAYRYLVVQQHWIGHLCDPGNGPWWCHPRTGLTLFFQYSGFGILAVLFGFLALWATPVQLTPDTTEPEVVVDTRWPGASPLEVEREIVD
ncbi:MAG: efflux RND transporter permease subunit, partial [Oceanibaculum sp.]